MAGKTNRSGLKDSQKKFCDYYLLSMNATYAALEAGYSERTAASQGSRLLKNVKIQDYLEKRRKKTEEVVGISREKMLRSLEITRARALEPSIVRNIFGNPIIMEVEVPVDEDEDPEGLKETKKVHAVMVRDNPKAVISAVDQIAKYQGWHSPTKVQDVTESPLAKIGQRIFGSE